MQVVTVSCNIMKVLKMKGLQIMNQLFVNIKVDREERPDLDFIFQSYFNYLIKQEVGGLTMFLDENGVPFMEALIFLKKQSKCHHLKKFKKFGSLQRSKGK